uniref:Uncharacterized protein n=1 Tax=Marseillevirus LCMAC101 TaxID=2506602 RepID=A0A481YSB3_9VIRU|nr:MAG: hypothetical protein LCMAC101_07480 [Marseillevirus LCMAC101]
MITVDKVQDGVSSLKSEIRSMGEREKLITLFVIGFIFYQYVPVSAVAGYFLGGLVTTLVYVTAISMITFAYFYHAYGQYLDLTTIILRLWNTLEEGKKLAEIEDERKRKEEKAEREKADIKIKINMKEALEELKEEEEVKKKEEGVERRRKEMEELGQEAERRFLEKESREGEAERKREEEDTEKKDMVKKEVERIKESERERNQKVRKVACELGAVSCKCNKKRLDKLGLIVN